MLYRLVHVQEVDATRSGLRSAAGLARCAAATRVDLSENRLAAGLPRPPVYTGPGAWEPVRADEEELCEMWGGAGEPAQERPPSQTPRRLWPRLAVFVARRNRLTAVPESFFPHCAFLRRLDLASNALTDLPPSIACLKLLEEADVSSNTLSSLERFRGLPSLRVLRAQHNKIRHLNGVPSSLPCLETADLSHNPIRSLAGFHGCARLRTCALHSTAVEKHRDVVTLDTCPNLMSLDLRKAPLATGSPEACAEYRIRVLHALPSLETLDGVPVTSKDRVKAADAHGEWEGGRAGVHALLLPDRPRRSRQRALEAMGGEPTLMLRRGVRQDGVFLVLEVWDSEGPSGGLVVRAYLPESSGDAATVRVSADQYQETFDAVAAARAGGGGAKGSEAGGGHADDAPPTAMEVVEALLGRVRAHFRAGAKTAAPALWLAPADGPVRKELRVKRTIRCAQGAAIVEVTPSGPASYRVTSYVPQTSSRMGVEATGAQTAALVGGDAANPGLATERRREIMEALAAAARVEHFAGRDSLSLEPAADSLCL